MIAAAKKLENEGPILLVNSRLFCPKTGRDEAGGLRIENGIIADLGPPS
jgi:hypothetical protein